MMSLFSAVGMVLVDVAVIQFVEIWAGSNHHCGPMGCYNFYEWMYYIWVTVREGGGGGGGVCM